MYFQFLASKTFQCNFFFAYSNFTERDIFKFSCNFLTQFFSFFLFFLNIQFPRNVPIQIFHNFLISLFLRIFKFHGTHITSKFFIRLSNTCFEAIQVFLHFQIFLATAISQYNIFFFSYDIYVYNISKFSSTISNFRETHGDSTYEFPRLELYYTVISFPKFFVSNYQQMKKPRF